MKLEKLRDCRGFSHVYQALVLYKQLNGHLEVSRAWVVPSEVDGPWPRHLWGMRLGRTVYDIKRKAAYSKNYYQVIFCFIFLQPVCITYLYIAMKINNLSSIYSICLVKRYY